MMAVYVPNLLKGVTDFLLLSIINELPNHGYQILKELNRRSQGYFNFKSGTVYPALRRLEMAGLITGRWQQVSGRQRRRYYEISDLGHRILAEKLGEWQNFCIAVGKLVNSSTDSLEITL